MDVFGIILLAIAAGVVSYWTLRATRKRCWNCKQWIGHRERVCPRCGRQQPMR